MALFNDLRRSTRSPITRREQDQSYLDQAQKEADDKQRQDAADLKAAARAQAAEQRRVQAEQEREERDAKRQQDQIESRMVADRKAQGFAYDTDPMTGKDKPMTDPADKTGGHLRRLQGDNLFETPEGTPKAFDPVKGVYSDAREKAKAEYKDGKAIAKIGGKEYDVSDRPEHAERLKNQAALATEEKKALAASEALKTGEAEQDRAYNLAKERRDAAKLKLDVATTSGTPEDFDAATTELQAATAEADKALAASKGDPVAKREIAMREKMVDTLKDDEKHGKLSQDWEDYLNPVNPEVQKAQADRAAAQITPETVKTLPREEVESTLKATDDKIKASSAELNAKTAAINARIQPLADNLTAIDAKRQQLAQQNALALATTPKDQIITLDDGSTWNKGLFEQYKATHEQFKQAQGVYDSTLAQLQPNLSDIESHRATLTAEQAAHGANVDQYNKQAQADRAAYMGKLRQSPGTAGYADQIEALDAETEANRAALDELPDDQRQAAVAAMETVQAQKRQAIQAGISGAVKADYDNNQKKQAAGAKLYQEVKKAPNVGILPTTLDELGLTREEGEKLIELNRGADFTVGNKADKARVLNDGSIATNPTIWTDHTAAIEAINATDATPEQKKAAIAQVPVNAENANRATLAALLGERIGDFMKETGLSTVAKFTPMTAAWEALKNLSPKIGGTDIRDFAKQHGADALLDTTGRKVEASELTNSDYKSVTALMEAWQKENGMAQQYIKQFQLGLAQGLVGIGQQAAALMGAVGSDYGMRMSTDANNINKAFSGTSGALQNGQWVATATNTAVNLAPTMIGGTGVGLLGRAIAAGLEAKGAITAVEAAALAGKFAMAGSAGAGGVQQFATTFGGAYDANRAKGMSDADAFKAAYVPAFADGLVSSLATHFTPKVLAGIAPKIFGEGVQGVESLALNASQRGFVNQAKRTITDYVKAFSQGAASEASEELVQQFASDVIAKASYEPDKTWAEIINNALESAKWGAIFGGTIESISHNTGEAPQATALPQQPAPVAPKGPEAPSNTSALTPSNSDLLKRGINEASRVELSDPSNPLTAKATVLRDIAQGADVSTMPEAKLNTVGLTHKGDKVAPMTGKDAAGNPITPAVQVDADGNAIILQPAIDELAAAFPTTAKLIGMSEQQIREMLKARKEGPPTGQGTGGSTPPTEVAPEQAPAQPPVTSTTQPGKTTAPTWTSGIISITKGEPVQPVETTEKPAQRWEITNAAGDVVYSIPKDRAKSGKEAFSIFTKMNDGGEPLIRANVGLSTPKVQERAVSPTVATEKAQETPIAGNPSEELQKQNWTANWNEGDQKFKATLGSKVIGKYETHAEAMDALNQAVTTQDPADASPIRMTDTKTPAKVASVIPQTAKPKTEGKPGDKLRQWAKDFPKAPTQYAEFVAEYLDKTGGLFGGIVIEDTQGESGIEYQPGSNFLRIWPAKLHNTLSQARDSKSVGEAMKAMMNEEVDHLITGLLIESSPDFSAALDAVWDALPKSVKDASSKAYNKNTEAGPLNEEHAKYEFVRQYRQVASFQTLTEASLREAGLIGKLKTFIAQYIRALRKIVKGKLHPEVKAKMDGILAAMEAKAKELQGVTDTKAVEPVTAKPEPAAEKPVTETAPETPKNVTGDSATILAKAEKTEALAKQMKSKAQKAKLTEQAEALRRKAEALATPVDEAAHEAATSPLNDTPEPTQAQKESGNYRMGHTNIAGLDISIENPAGSERKGVDKAGKPWGIEMQDHYGYVKSTTGKDGDHLDIFVKAGTPEDYTGPVFVVNQNVDGKFDETKSVIGVATAEEARALYDRNYSKGWKGFDSIATFPTVDAYKEWLKGDHSGKAPADKPDAEVSNDTKPALVKFYTSGQSKPFWIKQADLDNPAKTKLRAYKEDGETFQPFPGTDSAIIARGNLLTEAPKPYVIFDIDGNRMASRANFTEAEKLANKLNKAGKKVGGIAQEGDEIGASIFKGATPEGIAKINAHTGTTPTKTPEQERIDNGTKHIGDTASERPAPQESKAEPVADNIAAFTADMKPMDKAKAKKVLEVQLRQNGVVKTRAQIVEEFAANGGKLAVETHFSPLTPMKIQELKREQDKLFGKVVNARGDESNPDVIRSREIKKMIDDGGYKKTETVMKWPDGSFRMKSTKIEQDYFKFLQNKPQTQEAPFNEPTTPNEAPDADRPGRPAVSVQDAQSVEPTQEEGQGQAQREGRERAEVEAQPGRGNEGNDADAVTTEKPAGTKMDFSAELPAVGDEVSWIGGDGRQAISMVSAIRDGKATVDWFGTKFVPIGDLTIRKKSNRRIADEERLAKATAPVPKILAIEDKMSPKAQEKSRIDNGVAKEQKKYLITALESAIEAAPDVHLDINTDASKDRSALDKSTEDATSQISGTSQEAARNRQKLIADAMADLMTKYKIREKGSETTRVIELGKAIDAAHKNQLPHITIEIPGDGVFSILNTKNDLRAFMKKASKFPVTAPRPNVPAQNSPQEPSAVPALVVKPKNEDYVKAVSLATTTDATRYVLLHAVSDGETLVATNGRLLIYFNKKIAGTKEAPVWYKDGKPISGKSHEDMEYPRWRQVVPDDSKFVTVFKDLDTERLMRVLIQAKSIEDIDATSPPTVKIYINPDKTLGLSAVDPKTGDYEHNIQDGTALIGAFNPDLLMTVIKAARWTGGDKISIKGENDESPFILESGDMRAVVMPMRTNTSNARGVDGSDWKKAQKILSGDTSSDVEPVKKTAAKAKTPPAPVEPVAPEPAAETPSVAEEPPVSAIASETTASLDDRAPLAPITNHETAREFLIALREGNVTADQVKAAWEQFKGSEKAIRVELQKMTKDDLLKMASYGARAADSKASIANNVYGVIESNFNPEDFLSYGGTIGTVGVTKAEAMEQAVAKWTDEKIQKAAEERKAAKADRERALTDPKTKEEWESFVYRAGRKALTGEEQREILKIKSQNGRNAAVVAKGEKVITPEQLAAFDEIRGLDRKAAAERQQEVKAVVRGVNAGTESEIIETKHTQKGHDLFVVKLADRVEKDTYSMLNNAAKRLGGYYSSFRGPGAVPGFQFKTRAEAEQFQAITKGETVDRTEAVQEKREEKKNAAAERMIAYADRLDEQADESLNKERQTNTHKRATQAGHAEADARKQKALAETMRNLAAAMQSGEATHLDGVSTGKQVETLRELAKQAKTESERNLSYGEREKLSGETPTLEMMDKATYPFPYIQKSDLLKMAEQGRNTPGAKLLANKVALISLRNKYDNQDGEMTNAEDIENFRTLAKKLTERGKTLWDGYAWKFENYDRLQRMGLKDLPSLRAALREFTQFQGKQAKADPLKEMERALIGVDIPGFFPTPATVINKMMDEADIKEGMDVLEPSAGKGDIADRAKAAGANVDTVEISSRLRDILEAKGHKVIASDIMSINPRGFTYGDTFRAPDGREGIMRGLGGMGSGRVRLVVDGNERNPSYENRADLVGVKKNGSSGYDRILMNPPFENGQDIEHVMHAYNLLKPGGKLVAIMSEGPFFRSDKKATAFREWLDEHGTSEKLDAGSFKGAEAFRQTSTNTRMVVIEKPTTALSAPAPAKNNVVEPGFFSQLETVLADKMGGSMPAEDLKKVITNSQSGIKAEEIKWSGIMPVIDRLAEENGGKVPKEALLEHLRNDGRVKFEEVTRGATTKPRIVAEANDDGEAGYSLYNGDEFVEWYETKSEAEENIGNLESVQGEDSTKYAQYQLPGGENYREVVLSMPTKGDVDTIGYQVVAKDGRYDGIPHASEGLARAEVLRMAERNRNSVRDYDIKQITYKAPPKAEYTSSHFSDIPNYVAHMRLNDRTDAAGKPGTFIEEIQSDRHQAGREKGYQEDALDTSDEAVKRFFGLTGDISAEDMVEYRKDMVAHPTFKNKHKIPDAPFRKEWPLQMFKRALRDAVASGKEWIGWTTGDTQSDRFDLSKQVDSIRIVKHSADDFSIYARKDGIDGPVLSEKHITASRVADVIGKDLAEKATQQTTESHTYSGEALKIGSTGMKGFYDNILPKEIGKYVKQWGAKVEQSSIADESVKTMADEGWMVGGRNGNFTVYKAIPDPAPSEGSLDSAIQGDKIQGNFPTWKAAEEWAKSNVSTPKTTPIWLVSITPEMREGVTAGQALFAPAPAYNPRDQRNIEDFAASEAPGDKTIGDPRIANPGRTPEQRAFFDAAYWTYINSKGTLTDAEIQKTGREVAARWPDEVKAAVMDSAENGQPLDATTTAAAAVINREMIAKALASDKESDRQAARDFSFAYIKTGSDISEAFRARKDQTMTMQDRIKDFMSWALTEPVRWTVKLDAANAPARTAMLKHIESLESELAEAKEQGASKDRVKFLEEQLKAMESKTTREQKLHEAAEETIKFIKKALKREGMTVDDLMGGRVEMRRNVSRLIMDAAAPGDVNKAKAIDHIIHGWPTKKVMRSTGYTEAQVDEIRDSIKTDPKVREQLFKYFKQGGKLEELIPGAIAAPSAAAISDEEAMALVAKALELAVPSKKQADNSQWKKQKRDDVKPGKYKGLSDSNATAQKTIDRLTAVLNKTAPPAAEKPETTPLADLISEHRTEGVDDFKQEAQALGVTEERAEALDALLNTVRANTSAVKAKALTPAGVMDGAIARLKKNGVSVTAWKTPRAKTAIERLVAQHIRKGVKDFEKKAVAMGATEEQARALNTLSFAERSRAKLVAAIKAKALEESEAFDITDEYVPLDINNPNQVRRIMDAVAPGASTGGNIMKEIFYNSIFSAPVTHVASGIDQVLGTGLDAIFSRLPEAVAGSLMRAAGSNNPNLSSMTEYGAYLKPLMNSWGEAWKNAKDAWSTEQDVFRNNYLDSAADFDENAQGYVHRPAIPGKLGKYARIPTRMLATAETFFKTLNAKMAVGAEAMRLGMNQKLEGEALETFIRDQVADHGSEAWEKGAKHAMRLSMMDNKSIPATVMNMMFAKEAQFRQWEQDAIKSLNEGKRTDARLALAKIGFFRAWNTFFQIVVAPIRVVPANSLAYVFNHSPFKAFPMLARIASGTGFAVAGKGFGKGYTYGNGSNQEGTAQAIKDIAGLVPAAILTALLAGAAEGDDDDLDKMITIVGNRQRRGEDPSDYEATVRKYGGVQVIRLNIGGHITTIPYGRVSSTNLMLTPIVNALRTIKENKRTNRDWATPALWSVLGGLKQQGQDMPVFQGIGDLIKLAEDTTATNKGDSTISDDFRKIFERVVTSFIPYHNLTNKLIGSGDDTVRDIKNAEKLSDWLPIPGANLFTKRGVIGPAPQFAPEKLDVYGDPIKLTGNPVTRMLYPAASAPKPQTPADVAIEAFNRRKMEVAGSNLPAFKMLRAITKGDTQFTARDLETPMEKKRREAIGPDRYERQVTAGAEVKPIPMMPEMAQGFKELAGANFKRELESASGTVIKKDGKMVRIRKITMEEAKKGDPETIKNIDIIQREAIDEAKEFLVKHKDDKDWRIALKEKLRAVRQ